MWPLLDQRLTALEKRVDAGFAAIDHKLDNLAFVRADVYAAEQAATHRRLDDIERKLAPDGEVAQDITAAGRPGSWALNLMVGAFVVAMIGGIVAIALGRGG